MQLLNARYVYSATDLNNYLECEHLVALERRVAQGLLVRPQERDQTAQLIRTKGDEHEVRRLQAYAAEHGDALVSFTERPQNSRTGLAAAEAQTVAAMARGARIIYQATFFAGQFVGHADFLRRIEVPSGRWSWSYEVIDTKLALSPKPYFLIQLCNYSEHLERVQGSAPQYGYIVLGSGDERGFRMDQYAAYYRHLKRSFLAAVAKLDGAYPLEVPHCNVCAWSDACQRRRETDDHLSLVAGMRVDQMGKLEDAGITTMMQLATAPMRPWRMSETTFENLRTQAQLQDEQRRARARGDQMPYRYRFREEASPDEAARQTSTAGFAKLPAPARGDIFFDIEGDPLYRPDRGLEYLFGLYVPDEDRYVAYWAKDAGEERLAFEACVDFIAARLERHPDLHVYHYASYEKSVLRRLMGRFASREREIDDFLTRGIFVDLYSVVHQAMWISQPSYSLKKVEAFYEQKRSTQTKGGDDSIVMFERWLTSEDPTLLEDIERYNEDDCRSTYRLREWLVALRAEYNAGRQTPLPWRPTIESPPQQPEPPRTELERELLTGLGAPDSLAELRAAPSEFRARWLLGNLIQYHRRENKPEYWAYYERCENIEDLIEFDRYAIGGLRRRSDVAPYKVGSSKYFVYTYEYPLQEHYLRGGKPHCPDLRKGVTEVVEHDGAAREIRLKLSAEMAQRLRALIPGSPLSHSDRQAAVERIARAYLDGRLASEHPATMALLLGALPRLRDRASGTRLQPDTVDAPSLARTIEALDGSYLFVQGPPGSGKATLGATAIVKLLQANQRVGIMANNHKALHNLLEKVEMTAQEAGIAFVGCHKHSDSTEGSSYPSPLATPLVCNVSKASELLAGKLASGTAFAWPDESLTGQFDYMFIDEAG
ncbi:MAG: TM0106 family RecB-like putative nuclease, partial [Candidatus Eremiobacteraeota bacterium]|nr:TM0106 family RecB-like putative nuclease [Candidatus Eremiobacteraeota bacterium]